MCNFSAIENDIDANSNDVNRRMVEYAKAVVDGRPHFHISIVNNDAAVVPDIGMFASFDPVALDRACIEAVNAAPIISSSVLGQCEHGHDHFTSVHPTTNWRSQIEHAEAIGLGSGEYELITL